MSCYLRIGEGCRPPSPFLRRLSSIGTWLNSLSVSCKSTHLMFNLVDAWVTLRDVVFLGSRSFFWSINLKFLNSVKRLLSQHFEDAFSSLSPNESLWLNLERSTERLWLLSKVIDSSNFHFVSWPGAKVFLAFSAFLFADFCDCCFLAAPMSLSSWRVSWLFNPSSFWLTTTATCLDCWRLDSTWSGGEFSNCFSADWAKSHGSVPFNSMSTFGEFDPI